jgi:putative ubiquitin-RnfH superfamily antitoxin RatB of RatAB toxin-antitoxin module
MLPVEVVYIPYEGSIFQVHLKIAAETSVGAVLQQSGLFSQYPDAEHLPVGIFAKTVTLSTLVKPGDRIEVYRALCLDPKEKRRQRARSNSG